MQFKYKYEHLDCTLCADRTDGDCRHLFCPHIMENLNDLRHDRAFAAAIDKAGSCKTPHRAALMLLKARNFACKEKKQKQATQPAVSQEAQCNFKPECAGCPYPHHGFICYDERNGSCLKTDMDRIAQRRGAYAGALG